MGLGTNRDYVTGNRAIERRLKMHRMLTERYMREEGMEYAAASAKAYKEVVAFGIPGTKRLPARLRGLGIPE